MRTGTIVTAFFIAFIVVSPHIASAEIDRINNLSNSSQFLATTTGATSAHLKIFSANRTHTFQWDGTPWLVNQGGTGATSFSNGGLLFFLNGVFSQNVANLFWDSLTNALGIGNSSPQHRLDVSGAIYSRLVNTSAAVDWNTGNVQSLTLTSSPTLTFANGQAGGEYKLILKQDSVGGRTVVWPSSVQWPGGNAPILTVAPNAKDVISFVNDGTNYLGSYSLNYLTTPPPPSGLLSGLVSYWKFDGDGTDATANSNILTNNNSAAFVTGKINSGANLVRSSQQYFSIADNVQTGLDVVGDMTINGWVNFPSALNTDIYGFVSKCDNSSRSWCTLINNASADQFSLAISDDGSSTGQSNVLFSGPFSINTWYMVTIVYHSVAGTYDLYRDGTLQGTGTGLPQSIFNGTAEFRVGWDNNPSSTDGFNGVIDEVGIWSRALTSGEISNLYGGGSGLPYSSF